MTQTTDPEREVLARERGELLERVSAWLETPMLVLALVWLALLVWELVWGITRVLEVLGLAIWAIFIVAFVVEFALAPRKRDYLQRNWLTAISLVLPALRVFRFLRVLRAARGIRLVRVVGSLNRGMRSLGRSFGRRGFGYVVALTILVTVAGAAGMYAFERGVTPELRTYGDALWWTAMIMTTMGSAAWPATPEGRVLCVMLALYAFAIFGYVTATLATYFVGRDAEDAESELASARSIAELKAEIAALRATLERRP